jgi:hypothetical protein
MLKYLFLKILSSTLSGIIARHVTSESQISEVRGETTPIDDTYFVHNDDQRYDALVIPTFLTMSICVQYMVL